MTLYNIETDKQTKNTQHNSLQAILLIKCSKSSKY